MLQIENLLLSAQEMEEEYAKLASKGITKTYFLEINKKSKILYFIGANHSNDANDPQSNFIKDKWSLFLKRTKKGGSIALCEGGIRQLEVSAEEAIIKDGESGLLTFLANLDKVEIASPEPDQYEEIKHLEKHFNKNEIMYYYFARTALQWHRLPNKPDFNSYLDRYLKRYKQETKWLDFDFSIHNMIRIHNELHDHQFNIDNELCFYKSSAPASNPVSEASGHFRDTFIVSEILRYWGEGKSIFIVYGSGHLIVQKRALETLLN